MSSTFITLDGAQVFEISHIESGRPYQNGKRAEEGKTFSRFRYNSIIFTVEDTNPFVAAFDKGEVTSVKLAQGVREIINVDENGEEVKSEAATLNFDSFVSYAQEGNLLAHQAKMAEQRAKIARYQKLEKAPVSEDALKELLSA